MLFAYASVFNEGLRPQSTSTCLFASYGWTSSPCATCCMWWRRVVCRRASTLLISSLFWERLPVMGAWILWRCWGWNMWLGYLSAEKHASDTWYLYWVEKPKNKITCKKIRESGHVYFDCGYDMMSTASFPVSLLNHLMYWSFEQLQNWISARFCKHLGTSWSILEYWQAFTGIITPIDGSKIGSHLSSAFESSYSAC